MHTIMHSDTDNGRMMSKFQIIKTQTQTNISKNAWKAQFKEIGGWMQTQGEGG